jgi:hypothetical protein
MAFPLALAVATQDVGTVFLIQRFTFEQFFNLIPQLTQWQTALLATLQVALELACDE